MAANDMSGNGHHAHSCCITQAGVAALGELRRASAVQICEPISSPRESRRESRRPTELRRAHGEPSVALSPD